MGGLVVYRSSFGKVPNGTMVRAADRRTCRLDSLGDRGRAFTPLIRRLNDRYRPFDTAHRFGRVLLVLYRDDKTLDLSWIKAQRFLIIPLDQGVADAHANLARANQGKIRAALALARKRGERFTCSV